MPEHDHNAYLVPSINYVLKVNNQYFYNTLKTVVLKTTQTVLFLFLLINLTLYNTK